jgi:hypothetical protein
MGRRNKDRWRDKLFQQKLEEEKQGIYGIWERWEGRDKETVNPEIPTSVKQVFHLVRRPWAYYPVFRKLLMGLQGRQMSCLSTLL